MKNLVFMIFCMAFLSLSSCVSAPVDKAFRGEMEKPKETKTIVTYCQSCHVHRNFSPGEHLNKITAEYKTAPYNSASDCRTCHSIKRDFWSDVIRYTYYPEGRLADE